MIIGRFPPQDGNYHECQCARCGSSCDFQQCDQCGGEGVDGHDCGDDTCCCLYPEDNVGCDICESHGGWWTCLSSPEWCKANPLEGRDAIERGEIEWFQVREEHA